MLKFKYNVTSPYQIFFAQPGACQFEGIIVLYNYIMSYLVGILFVVTTALFFIIFTHKHGRRHVFIFQEKANINTTINWMRYLQKWTHSTLLELIWTIIPTLILLAIAIPSFVLLYSLDEIVDTQCVVKIIAYQWYWKYEYPVFIEAFDDIYTFSYLSYMIPLEDLTLENNLRLLEVDTPLILPINVNIKLIITSKDVLHSFAIPALGIKMDAVPGRLNQVTLHIFKPGIYYGQCSELCGINHAFMPIVLNAIELKTFNFFVKEAVEVANKSFLAPFQSFGDCCIALQKYHTILKLQALLGMDSYTQIYFVVNENRGRQEILSRVLLYLIMDYNNVISSTGVQLYQDYVDWCKDDLVGVVDILFNDSMESWNIRKIIEHIILIQSLSDIIFDENTLFALDELKSIVVGFEFGELPAGIWIPLNCSLPAYYDWTYYDLASSPLDLAGYVGRSNINRFISGELCCDSLDDLLINCPEIINTLSFSKYLYIVLLGEKVLFDFYIRIGEPESMEQIQDLLEFLWFAIQLDSATDIHSFCLDPTMNEYYDDYVNFEQLLRSNPDYGLTPKPFWEWYAEWWGTEPCIRCIPCEESKKNAAEVAVSTTDVVDGTK